MPLTRPTNLEEMQQASAGFATDEGIQSGLSYIPDPTDIFVTPYSKCGTTWM